MNCTEKLRQEREKLDKMIEDALTQGDNIAENDEIQKQGRLVEQLIENMKAEQ